MTIHTDMNAQELSQQQDQLYCEIGKPGSGYTRYSAAMYFYMKGYVSAELLEIYRRCCKFDHENPLELATHEGIDTALDIKPKKLRQCEQ